MPVYAGKLGRITVGGAVLRGVRWTASVRCQEDDVTRADGLRARSVVGGIEEASVSFEAFWSPEDNPFDETGLNLIPNETWSDLRIYLNRADAGLYWQWLRGLWVSVESFAAPRDLIHYTVTGTPTSLTVFPSNITVPFPILP